VENGDDELSDANPFNNISLNFTNNHSQYNDPPTIHNQILKDNENMSEYGNEGKK
jgi:hypothetical protein